MGASATAGMQMVAARPFMSASHRMLTSRAAISRIDRVLSTSTVSAICPRITYSRPLSSSKRSDVVVRAMSGESSSQGLPIDLRGKLKSLDYTKKSMDLSVAFAYIFWVLIY